MTGVPRRAADLPCGPHAGRSVLRALQCPPGGPVKRTKSRYVGVLPCAAVRLLTVLCLGIAGTVFAAGVKHYEPTWESIDSRPTPGWWSDAKFGIFIHWGVYSVPSFAPKGEYAEWYWERIGRPGNPDPSSRDAAIRRESREFHERVYGKDFPYFDFAPRFRAEMFDADQWAGIFKRSGAKYVDLVSRYSPSVIFADGEWELPSARWRAPELLAWLYNESPVADKVVVNDRWGGETRHHHGGYYTTEYGAGLPGATHPWEENRGIGHSYGYNRNENLADYATGQQLLLTLLDTVSRGGNLLLNIGPTADGRIPVEMQERLAYLGQWLKVNGEAVYGTRTFRDGAQWTAGRRQEVDTSTNYRAKYDVEKLTLHPDAGDARKEVLFTRKGDVLYAILPVYRGGDLVLRGVRAAKGARVSLLGSRH